MVLALAVLVLWGQGPVWAGSHDGEAARSDVYHPISTGVNLPPHLGGVLEAGVHPGHRNTGIRVSGLASAAVIRPLKEKSLALALVVRSPVPGAPSAATFGGSVFKATSSLNASTSATDAFQWVVLTESWPNLTPQSRPNSKTATDLDATLDKDAWQYSMEVVYIPLASLSLHAAFSVAPEADSFDAVEPAGREPSSHVGVSIGLDYRPTERVVLDFDYARVMPGGVLSLGPWLATEPTGPAPDAASGVNVFRASLNIQF